MAHDKLKTAVMGLNQKGLLMLEAAVKSDYFHIEAVADQDSKLAEQTSQKYNCSSYDDYRQLVAQNNLDCLLVAAPTYIAYEYIKAAIKKKFHVLKTAPLARNFEEAFELVGLGEKEQVKFGIVNQYRFAQSFIALRKYFQEKKSDKIFLLSAECTRGDDYEPVWQTDPKLAGGGILINDSYQIIDQIILNFSLPQQVYSLNTNLATDKTQRLYLTEDTSAVIMKFGEEHIGNLTASRLFGSQNEILKIFSREEIFRVQKNLFSIEDTAKNIMERFEYNEDNLGLMIKAVQNFALSILAPAENNLISAAGENLKNMAFIESAYLSAKTGMPEEPSRFFAIKQVDEV